MAKTTRVELKALDDAAATVAGYGVVFGGIDLQGERFESTTDFMLELVPRKLVLYDHARGEIKHVLGHVKEIVLDEYGLWIEAELQRNAEYVEYVLQLVQRGALGWSSGTVGHLAERQGKSITRWPLIEFSLTPTPAEPRTLGVEIIKSLAATDAAFGALLPEAGRTPAAQSADASTVLAVLTIELDLLELERKGCRK